MKCIGQIAYEAYVEKFPGEAGRLAWSWDKLNPALRSAWQAAAETVVHQVRRASEPAR